MPSAASSRSRLRFASLERSPKPDGHCYIAVELEWGGEIRRAEADGFDTLQGRINTAAEAALDAMHAIVPEVRLTLVGVKAVKAFDGWVVVARLAGTQGERSQRLLGAAPCENEDELPDATVMALLDASNRVLERVLEATKAGGEPAGV